jgi:PAS domain S-box-containing protein
VSGKGGEAGRDLSIDYLEGLMEGFVAYDEDWRAVYINASGERLLGRRRQDVLGKRWLEAFPHAAGNPVDAMYQRVMRTRSPERLEYFYAHYGIWMEVGASPLSSGGIGVYFRDISDRKQAERGMLEEARTLETLNRIGKTLAAELDLERVVQAVTDAATEVSGAAFGAFFYNVTDDAGQSYMLYSLSGVEREAFSKFPMPRNTAVFAPTFSGERTVRSDDITRDPRYGKSGPHHGMPPGHLPVRSYLAVPVTSRSGHVLGGLFFGHERPGVFTERAERLVAGIAAQAAVAIDNARLFTDIRKAEEALRNADRRKDEFLATLAHELRNPLAPIRNGLHLLRIAGADANSARQAREMMERQVGHLVRLVDDLLELSRITGGKVDLRSETVDLAAVVLSAVETSRPAIEAARHKLDISLPAEPVTLHADFVRVAQVIANLLNNAAKYTDPGGHIALVVRREGGEAVVSVRDNGVGITPEMLPNIFDMFAQGSRTLDRAQGGLGIGLTLSRNLVELHGGKIEANSDGPGKGAEFIVRLPAREAAAAKDLTPFVALLHPGATRPAPRAP